MAIETNRRRPGMPEITRLGLKADLDALKDGTGLDDDVIDSRHIAAGAVNLEHIANDAVTKAKLAANSVTTAKIADNAVTEAKLVADSITTAKIANDAVTKAKLAFELNWGSNNISPNANGNGTIAHGLSGTPDVAFVQLVNDGPQEAEVQALDATNITVRIRNTTTNADVTTGTFATKWLVLRT